MSFEKNQTFKEKKDDSHLDSWKEEIEQSIGKSSKELGIYNEKEVREKLRNLSDEVLSRAELSFVNELNGLKNLDKEIGVYMVGGSIRDAILDKEAKDIDLVVNGITPSELVTILLKYGKVIFDRDPKADLINMSLDDKKKLIEESYGVIKFKPDNSKLNEPIDIAFPRTDDYEESGKSGIKGIKRDTNSKADSDLNIRPLRKLKNML